MLDWWLENNFILPDNHLAFKKGRGTMEYLSSFIGNIYVNIRITIEIRGVFDSVNICTLISHLISLPPQQFYNKFISMFDKRNHVLSILLGSLNTRSTFTGPSQGSCTSPILFNIYMSITKNHLTLLNHKCLIYADEMIIFTPNKSLN